MSSSIIPIQELDGERAYRAFFTPEFLSQRLGKPGLWQGGAMDKLDLKNPVAPEPFGRLLQGLTPTGEALLGRLQLTPDRVQGWRLILRDDSPVSTLWAVAPTLVRARIQLAHNQAVRTALTDFEHTLNGRPFFHKDFDPRRQHIVFAKFHSGASQRQDPRLQTTVFLPNLIIRSQGLIEGFTPDQVERLDSQMQNTYAQALHARVLWVLGEKLQMPKELSKCFETEVAAHATQGRFTANSPPLEGRQLFAAWQDLAQQWGWGPEKVAGLLRDAKSQPTWRNRTEDWARLPRRFSLWLHEPHRSPMRIMKGLLKNQELANQGQPCPTQPSEQKDSKQDQGKDGAKEQGQNGTKDQDRPKEEGQNGTKEQGQNVTKEQGQNTTKEQGQNATKEQGQNATKEQGQNSTKDKDAAKDRDHGHSY